MLLQRRPMQTALGLTYADILQLPVHRARAMCEWLAERWEAEAAELGRLPRGGA